MSPYMETDLGRGAAAWTGFESRFFRSLKELRGNTFRKNKLSSGWDIQKYTFLGGHFLKNCCHWGYKLKLTWTCSSKIVHLKSQSRKCMFKHQDYDCKWSRGCDIKNYIFPGGHFLENGCHWGYKSKLTWPCSSEIVQLKSQSLNIYV